MYEAKYIETVWNWRRACDERGLTELQRCRFNMQFLNLILEELMPWHKTLYDFSTIEVNRFVMHFSYKCFIINACRRIDNILGFSRETLVACIANIGSREWRRIDSVNQRRKPEHPRASTTDDVECFFSVMRDSIGKNFTTKQMNLGFRKACIEFTKRLDPDLKFYYHTSSHTRFYEGQLSDFADSSRKKKRKNKRIPRREQPAAFAPRRATMPTRGSLTVRAQFHNVPIELPPLPSDSLHVLEHSYA